MGIVIQPYEVVQGNYGQQLYFVIVDGQGNPVDLGGSVLTLKVQAANDSTGADVLLGGNPVAVDDAPNGKCHYTVAAGDFPSPGKFLAQIDIAGAGSLVSAPGIVIQVVPSLPQSNN